MHTTLLSLVRRERALRRRGKCPGGATMYSTNMTLLHSDGWTLYKNLHHAHVGGSEWSGTRPRAEYNFPTSDSTSLDVQRVQRAPRCLELGVLTPVGRTESLVESSNDGTFTTDVCDDTSGYPALLTTDRLNDARCF